jgi:hypothetical protein
MIPILTFLSLALVFVSAWLTIVIRERNAWRRIASELLALHKRKSP